MLKSARSSHRTILRSRPIAFQIVRHLEKGDLYKPTEHLLPDYYNTICVTGTAFPQGLRLQHSPRRNDISDAIGDLHIAERKRASPAVCSFSVQGSSASFTSRYQPFRHRRNSSVKEVATLCSPQNGFMKTQRKRTSWSSSSLPS